MTSCISWVLVAIQEPLTISNFTNSCLPPLNLTTNNHENREIWAKKNIEMRNFILARRTRSNGKENKSVGRTSTSDVCVDDLSEEKFESITNYQREWHVDFRLVYVLVCPTEEEINFIEDTTVDSSRPNNTNIVPFFFSYHYSSRRFSLFRFMEQARKVVVPWFRQCW